MNPYKRTVSILLIALVHIVALSSAWAGTSASISVSGNEGAISVTAAATFMEDIHCNSSGSSCWPVSSGTVSIYQDNQYKGSVGGNGSATFTKIFDGGSLSQGPHTFMAVANDHEGGRAFDSQTITIDNTPTIKVNSPGLVAGAFDITGTVAFKEHVTGNEGSISLYIDNQYRGNKYFEGTSINWKASDFISSSTWLDAGFYAQGTHTIMVIAYAANGATHMAETTITIDNTPTVTVNSPGPVAGAFDITGTVAFKERVTGNEGSISLYIDNQYRGYKYFEGTSINWKYSEMFGSMLNASNFSLGVHTVMVVAYASNGAQSRAQGTFEVTKCDLKINNFTGNSGTINPAGGETFTLSADITDSSGKGVKWTMNIAGRSYSGTTKDVNVKWDGKGGDGKPLSSGTYSASLHAETEDGQCKADAPTLSILVDNDNGCSLKVVFGSTANIATGNLAHEQELFSTSGTGLNTAITLYYNSLDSHNGALGLGWSHTYDISLVAQGDGSVLIRKGNGESRWYRYADGVYTAPPGDYSTLVKRSDGYTLTHKDGTQYNFSLNGALASIMDRNTNTMRFTYNYGMLTSITDPVGRSTEFLHDLNGKLVQITDPGGKAYGFAVEGDCLTRVTMPDGGNWLYAYNAYGLLRTRTDAAGYTTTYAYDDQLRVKTATDPEGKTRAISYSTSDATEKTATVTEKDGSVWQFTYDSKHGNLVAKTDPAGNAIRYTYDGNHNLLGKTEADGSATSYGYDPKGNMLWSVDPLGNRTSYTYNEAGQVTSITDAVTGTTGFSYDGNGNLTKATDAAGGTTKYGYDASGQITSITNQAGQTITLAYDAQGNVIAVTDPAGAKTSLAYDAAGRVISQADAAGQITRFAYDAGGNLARVTDPSGKITLFGYDQSGNRTSQTDANGRTTRYVYDYARRVVRITDALGQSTSLTYAEAGCATCGAGQKAQPATVTDANGHTTWFQYDSLGRMVREIDQLGARISYQYDAKGNVIARTDGEGRTTRYSYDALGRLVAKVYPDMNQALFRYDAKGRMISAANQHIGYTMAYDTLGRLTGITDSNHRTIQYQYDALGNRVKMTTPEGKVVQYSYDEANRLVGMESFLGNFKFDYDRLGRKISLAQPNGVTTSYGYDAVGRLTSLLAQIGGGRGRGGVVNAFGYTYDAVGNRLSKSVSMSDHGRQDVRYDYAYDAVYQLLQSLPSGGKGNTVRAERYTYDPVGNRLTGPERNDASRYNEVNELMASRRSSGYQYDYNGNLTGKDDWTYAYDYENRLIRATKTEPGGIKTVSFKYDPFGRRTEKRVEEIKDGRVEARAFTYVYDNEDIILEYRTGSDETDDAPRDRGRVKVSRFVHGPGVDAPLAMEQKGRVYFYHADGLGSIVSLTDQCGRVVQSFDYDSFGNMQRHGGEVKQPYGFTGREWDKELGLYYYRARYYDPVAGRFIGKDPIGFAGGDVNLYRYVQNNPVNYTDPTGLVSVGEALTQIGAVGLIDAWTARQIADKSQSAAANSGLPGLHNGQADAYRHCLWSCQMGKAIGTEQAEDVGNIHEKYGKNPPGETCMDLYNNAQGRNAASTPDCAASCRELLTGGKLQTSPGGTPLSNLY